MKNALHKHLSLVVILLIVFMLGFATTQAQETGSGFVRFVHVIPSAPSLDVFVNGTLTAVDLSYEEVTPFVALPAGTHELTAALTGDTNPVLTQSVTVSAGAYQTLIASSAFPLAFDSYEDDLNTLTLSSSRFRLVNAIANSSPIDFTAAGQSFATDFAYKASTNTTDIPANAYPMSVSATGSTDAVWEENVALTGRTSNTLVLYGTDAAPQSMLLTTPVLAEGDSGFVRFAHGIAGAPEVNILLNGSLVVPSVEYGEATAHLSLEAGSYELSVQTTDGSEVATGTLDVETGSAVTAAVLETGLTVFEDAVGGVDGENAVISVINTTADTVSVNVGDTVITTDLAVGAASDGVQVAPVAAPLTLTFGDASVDTQTEVFYGGVYYNILILADGTLTIAPTSLAQTLGSAPGAGEVTPVVAAQPTETPVVSVEPVATTAPVAAPTQVISTDLPTARVVLDPGANQQLRELPGADKRSLGVAPSGTVFIVNGREGAPVDINGVEIPVSTDEAGNAVMFVDPATQLAEGVSDLNPGDTWLNITYNTPDGGTITAWVNAFTLEVREPDGSLQRLADLPMIPGNQPGEASNTTVSAPSERQDVLSVIPANLNEGVNLNVRRTPETVGEVLVAVTTGTQLELIGIGESNEWAFVRYLPPSGGDVTGWVSIQYINFQFNGQLITLEAIEERNLRVDADETVLRGEVRADVVLITPTVNPFRDRVVGTVAGLNADANLNLRRSPNIAAEVIARLPNGTQFIVVSKTASLDWYEVEFQGETGWVASQYVPTLTFNNLSYNAEDVPVNEDITNDSDLNETPNAPTPTATPTS